jgi:DNA-binding transcriptional regulator GbsR (MarR family)
MKMLKQILQDIWVWFWSKTTVDEKAVEVIKETKQRVKRVKEELQDVKETSEELLSQLKDVGEAAIGSKRKGRPKKNK